MLEDVIDIAEECGTLVDDDDDDGVGIIMLDVRIERGGGTAPGSVPPIPGTPAKPPV